MEEKDELRKLVVEYNQTNKLLTESKKRLKRAQEIAHVGNWEIVLPTGTIWVSEEAYQLCGMKMENHIIALDKIRKLIHVEDRNKIYKALNRLIEGEASFDVNFKINRADNLKVRNMHSIAEVEYDHEGKAIKIVGVIQDVTERINYELELENKNRELTLLYEELRESEYELRRQFYVIQANKELMALSEERYKTLLNNSHDIVYSCDLEGRFTTINEMFIQGVGLPRKSILGKTIVDIQKDLGYIKKWNNAFKEAISEGRVSCFTYRYARRVGGWVGYYDVTLSPLYDIHKKIVGVIGTNHDITAIKENEEKIKHMAFYDLITDLPNRASFLDRLNNAIKLSKKKATQVIVFILDLDNFKVVNNTLGHATGDALLIETAKRLRKCINVKDTVARLSGDEFSLLLEDVEQEDEIVYFLRKIRSVFEEPFSIENGTISLTASIGVSVYPDDGDTNEELINNATTAMYKAKKFGKNRYDFFDYKMKHDLLRKIYIDRALRKAIKNNEFVLFYQPQYTINRELRGFEALIRWNSPELGFMNPMEFIPIAEESGLVNQIGEWVLNTAVHACKKVEEKYRYNLIMAVNISPIQLRQKDFIEIVTKAIESSGVKPTSVELEVTESSFIDSYDSVAHKLKSLMEFGVRVALDDFGTGYSSLSYLKKLPINLLKIDKSFIQEIDFINTQNNLTESIISLVNKLNIETIAEGVETIEQINYLTNAKCDYIQGYYLGRPGPEESLGRVIEKALNLYQMPKRELGT
jgi:PAS domain S-box/diguanylate cyclase (GGDEF) domain